jgi:adenosylhomocysteine nucleosidase
MIGIIGAMDDEVLYLHSAMSDTSSQKSGAFEYISGVLEGKEVVLLRSGMGKVNAAVGCAYMIFQYKPSLVINTGCAGGIDSALSFGDIVISNGLVYHDVDITGLNLKPGQLPGQPAIFPVEANFQTAAERAIDELKAEGVFPKNLNHIRGLIGTGDIFMHRTEKIAEVRKNFPGIKAVEMEGAAIAHTCYLFSIPSLIIRSLSDIAGVESPMSFEEFVVLASKNSATLVQRIVKNL